MLLANRVNNLFDEMFNDPFFSSPTWFDHSQMMKTDVQEKDGNYLIDMELPGYAKEDIQAELKDGYLTVTANHNETKDEKDEEGNYVRRERYSGSCKRSFYVGNQVKQEDIQAAFKDGILRLAVPKEITGIEEKTNYIAIE
ncbi:heat shock protein Hsp20 [Lachnotalea glycerini]|jgi:HSP20 family protein|uniref:Heat shock protein Hsp20 n=1 Tax=Lachnotalea glycerini TaxID=1763509 RepID=A0A255ILG5_9FIRM|nr:Hsp20/alpha crystallin family protein [Lachnotalea glycerini]PXV91579.1 heat shock protein Hsp20 [Lachnotalea glycerini]RDY28611.1 Hsp20/alpha crystallin family protein [Lachnotalea glycerini]